MVRPVILANCLVKKDNKYVLVKEATDKVYGHINTHSKGKWTTPHGNVDEGEDIKTAAQRELLEETGGKTTVLRLAAIAQGTIEDTICILSFIFYGEGFTEVDKNRKNEIKEVGWFTREEIQKLEQNNQIRDNVPITKIIDLVENTNTVEFIEWEQPDHVKEIMKLLEKGDIKKQQRK